MNEPEQRAYILRKLFTLSNKLQSLGGEFDRNLTIKE